MSSEIQSGVPEDTALDVHGCPVELLERALREHSVEAPSSSEPDGRTHPRPEAVDLQVIEGEDRVRVVLTEGGSGAVYAMLRDLCGAERLTTDGESIAAAVIREARDRDLTIGAAESCTGGLVGGALTSVAGSSAVFWGSLVTYSYVAKMQVLGVREETLERHGAVSESVVVEMAQAVVNRYGVDLALAVSGIAGPGGGTPEKPVGTVWLACSARGQDPSTRRVQLDGDRGAVRRRSVTEGLVLLRTMLSP